MSARLRTRALALMKQLDEDGSGYRTIIERELSARLAGRAAAGVIESGPCASVRASGDAPRALLVRHGERRRCAVLQAVWRQAVGPDADEDRRTAMTPMSPPIDLTSRDGHVGRAAVRRDPGAARGQQAQQMPDPKTIAGIPLPVADVAVGTVVVRVIRGTLANNIPDQQVELTGAGAPRTVKTDATGRAEFAGLAPGTRVTATTTVQGERLQSQEFPVPATGGTRLLLVATDPDVEKRAAEDRSLAAAPAQAGPGRDRRGVAIRVRTRGWQPVRLQPPAARQHRQDARESAAADRVRVGRRRRPASRYSRTRRHRRRPPTAR